MSEKIREYLDKYPNAIKDLYISLRTLIMNAVSQQVEKKLGQNYPAIMLEKIL